MTGLSGSSPYDDLDDEEHLEDGWLDAPFDVSSVPGYGDGYFPPQAGTIMLDEVDDTVLDIIDGLWDLHDNMGGVPRIWIDPSAEEQIAARMRAAGFVIVNWSTFWECQPGLAPPVLVCFGPTCGGVGVVSLVRGECGGWRGWGRSAARRWRG